MKHNALFSLIILTAILAGCTTSPIATHTPTSPPVNTATPTVVVPASPTFTASPVIEPTSTWTPTPSGMPLFLSDLSPYHKPENIEQGLQTDREYWQREIWINGIHYTKGLGMHAPASGVGTVSYKVPPAYNIFISLIGLARQDKSPNCNGTARFRIYINKELVHESGILRFGETQGIRIPVQAGDILTLEVDNGGDTYTCDHSTWAGARFEP